VSKAFTRESDDSDEEVIPAPRPQLPPGARNLITREGADRLKNRLNECREKKRALATSEPNQRSTESEIRRLQNILDSIVIADTPADRERVAFGAKVTIRRGKEEEEEYRIVGVDETDLEQGRISWISPLARALLSRRAGEQVRFSSPAGDEELTILRVQFDGE